MPTIRNPVFAHCCPYGCYPSVLCERLITASQTLLDELDTDPDAVCISQPVYEAIVALRPILAALKED